MGLHFAVSNLIDMLKPRNEKCKRKVYIGKARYSSLMETVTLPKAELEQLQREIETLRNSSLYKRLLEFEKNIAEGKRFGRIDLGF